MLIDEVTPKAFCIRQLERLDPVTVYLDDHEPGRGTLTVRCFDRAWTCYWGSMGGGAKLARFIETVDAGYIANCLIRGVRGVISKRKTEDMEQAYLLRICEAIKLAVKLGYAA